MLEGLMMGLSTAFSFTNILMVVGGCLIGTFIGMLPGLGPMSIIAIMIPVAITIGDPSAALILLAGVYYGAVFGGSTSSILINAPGVASTVATSFDGYPMTRQGKAGKALTVAAISSFAGGTIGAILLMIFAPALASVALLFHSAEYFALMVVGLSAIAAFAGTGLSFVAHPAMRSKYFTCTGSTGTVVHKMITLTYNQINSIKQAIATSFPAQAVGCHQQWRETGWIFCIPQIVNAIAG